MKSDQNQNRPADFRAQITIAVVGLIVVIAGGWVHGQFTHRWGGGGDVTAAAAVLDQFPQSFGPWRQQSEDSMDEDVLETLQCANQISRTYLNTENAEQVSVAVIVGPAGPTAVHTPEICYSSKAYTIDQSRTKQAIEVNGASHTFWKTEFKPRQPGGSRLIVYYAWSDSQSWKASESPRYEFGGSPYLYKVQLAGTPLMHGDRNQKDICYRFIEDLIGSGWTTEAAE